MTSVFLRSLKADVDVFLVIMFCEMRKKRKTCSETQESHTIHHQQVSKISLSLSLFDDCRVWEKIMQKMQAVGRSVTVCSFSIQVLHSVQ